jgi:hypothetical protein
VRNDIIVGGLVEIDRIGRIGNVLDAETIVVARQIEEVAREGQAERISAVVGVGYGSDSLVPIYFVELNLERKRQASKPPSQISH